MMMWFSLDFWKKVFERKILWRLINRHNEARCVNIYNIHCVKVGRETYGPIDVEMTRSDYYLTIGDYCSIGTQVKFILSSEHPMDRVTTFPLCHKCGIEGEDVFAKGDIIVDDDVWIGTGATILSGVHLGQGSVVSAGAMVTKNVPPYAIVAGNPAKVIKYRFPEEIIKKLLEIDFKKIDRNFIRQNPELFLQKIDTVEQIEHIINRIQ